MYYKHNSEEVEPSTYESIDDVKQYLFAAYPVHSFMQSSTTTALTFLLNISIDTCVQIKVIEDNHRTFVNILLEFRDQTFKIISWGLNKIKRLSRLELVKFVLDAVRKGINYMHMIEKNSAASVLSNYLEGYKTGYTLDNFKNVCTNKNHSQYHWMFEQALPSSTSDMSAYISLHCSEGKVNTHLAISCNGSSVAIMQLGTKIPIQDLSLLYLMEALAVRNNYSGNTNNENDIAKNAFTHFYRVIVLDDLITTL